MKIFKVALMTILVGACSGLWAEELYNNMCSTPELLKKWSNFKIAELLPNGGPDNNYAIKISNDNAKKSAMIMMKISTAQIKGKTLIISANIKAEDVVVPSKKVYLGTKFMIYYKTADKKQRWIEGHGASLRSGSFPWKKITAKTKIPDNTVYTSINIGLQGASGTVYFSDIQVNCQ